MSGYYLPWIQERPLHLGELGAMVPDRTRPIFACLPWLNFSSSSSARVPLPFKTSRLHLHKLLDAAPYPFPGDCGCERFRKARYETDETFLRRKQKILREYAPGAYFPPQVVKECITEDVHSGSIGGSVGELNKLIMLENGSMIYPGGLAGDYIHTRAGVEEDAHHRKYQVGTPILKLQKGANSVLCATSNNLQLFSYKYKQNKLALNQEAIIPCEYLVNCDFSSTRIASLQARGCIKMYSDSDLRAQWEIPRATAMGISNERCIYAASRERLYLLDERNPHKTKCTEFVDFGGVPLNLAIDEYMMVISTQSRLLLFDCRLANYPLFQWSSADCFGSALDMTCIKPLPSLYKQCIYGVNNRSQIFVMPLEPNAEHRVVQTRHPRILDTLTCNAYFTIKEPAHVISGYDFVVGEHEMELWQLYRSGRITNQRITLSDSVGVASPLLSGELEQQYVEELADYLPLRWPKTETVIRPPTNLNQIQPQTLNQVEEGLVTLDEDQIHVLDKWGIKYTEERQIPRAVYDLLADVGTKVTPIHIDPDQLDPEVLDILNEWPEPVFEEDKEDSD